MIGEGDRPHEGETCERAAQGVAPVRREAERSRIDSCDRDIANDANIRENLDEQFRSLVSYPEMQKPAKRSVRTCTCVSMHTYPAFVTADAWNVVVFVCHCGREHFNELIPAVPEKGQRKRRAK